MLLLVYTKLKREKMFGKYKYFDTHMSFSQLNNLDLSIQK